MFFKLSAQRSIFGHLLQRAGIGPPVRPWDFCHGVSLEVTCNTLRGGVVHVITLIFYTTKRMPFGAGIPHHTHTGVRQTTKGNSTSTSPLLCYVLWGTTACTTHARHNSTAGWSSCKLHAQPRLSQQLRPRTMYHTKKTRPKHDHEVSLPTASAAVDTSIDSSTKNETQPTPIHKQILPYGPTRTARHINSAKRTNIVAHRVRRANVCLFVG